MDSAKCIALKKELQAQDEPQLVPIAQFFDGNDDEGSIGCNLVPHPGIPAFKEVLLGLTQRPNVRAVYALIAELDPGEESWPFSDTIVVIGSIAPETLYEALLHLEPDEVGSADPDSLGSALAEQDKSDALIAWWD